MTKDNYNKLLEDLKSIIKAGKGLVSDSALFLILDKQPVS